MSIQIKLDLQSRIPIYTQIVEQVKDLAEAGLLKPGDQLPTVREMAAELRINFNTVARAYRLLHEETIISTQQGRGTYVLPQVRPAEAADFRQAHLRAMVAGWLAEAQRQGFGADEVAQAWTEAFSPWGREPDP